MKKLILLYISIAAVSLYSCDTNISTKTESQHFDIPLFFKNEISTLQAENPFVTKTVSNEMSTEDKRLRISNWEKELAQFSNIDLNKAGSDDYSKKIIGDTILFESPKNTKNKLTLKVIRNNNLPTEIIINKTTSNLLFSNEETLHYVADSLYSIEKKQNVKGLGNNHYIIKGLIESL